MKIDIGIIHFERIFCLEKSIESLLPFIKTLEDRKLLGNMFICDDSFSQGSKEKCLDLAVKYGFIYLSTGGKKGLSSNNNLLVSSSKSEILFHLQDDFVFNVAFLDDLVSTLEIFIENDKQIMLRAFNIHEESLKFEYSDTPHFKKKEFHSKVGLYPLELPMHKAELFIKKIALATFTHENILFTKSSFFTHIGENHTFNPSNIREKRLRRFRILYIYLFLSRIIKRCLK